jgi:hypothetical protein
MTESATFSLYSIAVLLLLYSLLRPRPIWFFFAGLAFGLLCLTRASFAFAALVGIGLIVLAARWHDQQTIRQFVRGAAIFVLGWGLAVGPWVIRNGVSIGKWGLTEEYGSAALVERFAFDDMRLSEYLLAFPYCLPAIGRPAVKLAAGPDAMQRFEYQSPNSFFGAGRAHREQLRAAYGRLDPLIGRIAVVRTHQYPARLVRYVGGRNAWPRLAAAVRPRLRYDDTGVQVRPAWLFGARFAHVGNTCGRRKPLHAL